MANKNLQITNHDFLIYRDSNNDIKVSVMLINNGYVSKKRNEKK